MIKINDELVVSAIFDVGVFKDNFAVASMPDKNNQYGENIQTKYNLTKQDFTNLEIIIATAIYKYIKEGRFERNL
uniref:Uncharacterized protein n=1 Tax=viral metagenome TaxID=1070528 RepID=A0A6H1ZC16_9ZZZZ